MFNKKVSLNLIIIIIFILFIAFAAVPRGTYPPSPKQILSRVCADLETISNSIESYMHENNSFLDVKLGLSFLATNPDIKKYPNHRKRLKEKTLKDRWGNPYLYVRTNKGFEVFSFGSDGISGGEDEARDIFFSDCKGHRVRNYNFSN